MRGGSRGVKNKNIKLINGRPLMYYTIKQAIKSKIFNNIVVSTDSKKIFKLAKSFGAQGWFIRPKKLSSDSSSKVAAIKHALLESEKYYNKKFNFIVDLDVTSPLRKVKDIINAYKFFIRKNTDILITGTTSKKNPYFNMVEIRNKGVKKVINTKKKIFRRQDAPKTYDMNAAIYIWKRKALINSKSVIEVLQKKAKTKTILYEMPENRSIDIDSTFDFKLVEFLLKKNK
jgi:CMP-N,N'-diacetyllegionaminic acid synthase|tara:strand:- start:5715 stop:6404 length:690 start_codon:yes stop_codon:yes gene_type:complete